MPTLKVLTITMPDSPPSQDFPAKLIPLMQDPESQPEIYVYTITLLREPDITESFKTINYSPTHL